jgi:hypothetical protein
MPTVASAEMDRSLLGGKESGLTAITLKGWCHTPAEASKDGAYVRRPYVFEVLRF